MSGGTRSKLQVQWLADNANIFPGSILWDKGLICMSQSKGKRLFHRCGDECITLGVERSRPHMHCVRKARAFEARSMLQAVSFSAASLCDLSQKIGYPGGEDFPERKSIWLSRPFVPVANELLVHGEVIIVQNCLVWE